MIPAVAIVLPIVANSQLATWMVERSRQWGVDLQIKVVTADTRHEYKPTFHAFDNVISWGFRMPHAWMTKGDKNVLFIENGLINQRAGVFVDHRGLFSQSNLCRNQEWQFTDINLTRLEQCATQLKGKLGNWFNRSGPILITLQCNQDATLQQEYPLADKQPDRNAFTIETVEKYLPAGSRVVVRPHPREPDAIKNLSLPHQWSVQTSGTLASAIRGASAMISVNSTSVSEAALFGIPTAVLGTGVFTGCPAFLDCSKDPSKLAGLHQFQPSLKWQLAYVSAILAQHQMPYNGKDVPTAEFDSWLLRAISSAHHSHLPNPRLVQDLSTQAETSLASLVQS
jgi:hypothetical protein